MAYILWESASWSTSSADALYEDGNHVALEAVSAVVPSLLNLPLHTRVEVEVEVEAVEVVSEAALTVAVADSVEAVVAGSVEDVEEDLVTAGASVTAEALVTVVEVVSEAVAVASEVTGTTLDRREVEGASGAGVAVWDTKVEDSTTTARLRAGLEVPLDQAVVGLVALVGTVLLVGVLVTAPLEVVDLEVNEDISSERVQEGMTTETLSGRDSRCFAIAPHQVLL